MSRILAVAGEATSAHGANQGLRMTEDKKFNPYQEADKVDRLINELDGKHPMTQDNLNLWTLYHRTIQSTLTLMEKKMEKVSKDATV